MFQRDFGDEITTDSGQLLLVGSIARPEDGWSVEDVFTNCAQTLGPYLTMLPDGELGERNQWITFIVRNAYHGNPALKTISGHSVDDWKSEDYRGQWRLTVRDGFSEVHFEKIGYADAAKKSYKVFSRLRDQGVIPEGMRFLVAIPGTESAVRPFFSTAKDFEIVWKGYNEAIVRELEDLAANIPHEDLAIQWDLAREPAGIEKVDFNFADADLEYLPQDGMERFCLEMSELSAGLPADIWLGFHVCYGSLGHKAGESSDSAHYAKIKDVSVGVAMVNQGSEAAGRNVEFAHLPIQFSDGYDDKHYEALADLDVGDTRIYLGLIDSSDGVDAALTRREVATRHLSSFGLATACGWGRRPLEESLQDLIDLERDVAQKLPS